MLTVAALLLQLTLWVASVHAFLPFIPAGHCAPNEHCGSLGHGSKRSGEADSPAEGITLDLYRRPTGPSDPTNADAVAGTVARLARKFGRPHPFQASGLEKRANAYQISEPLPPTASNSAGIYQYGPDYSYFVKVQVGSAKQPLYMLLDTGAANTWLMSTKCDSAACTLHNLFDAAASKSYRLVSDYYYVNYGSGNVTGVTAADTFMLAGLTIPDLPFGLANVVHKDFAHFAFDGILGLGMSASATGTFLQELRVKKVLDSLVVGMSLNRGSDGVNDGQVTFGGVDKAKYTGDIKFNPIETEQKNKGEWAIRMGGASLNGKAAGPTSMIAYIDSGTSFIFAPPADLDALFKLVPETRTEKVDRYMEYYIPCDTKLPIELTFSGVEYEIPAKDWVMRKNESMCVSGLYGWDVRPGTGSWVVGDTFLKNVYTVFDAEKFRIGFAAKAPPSARPTGTAGVPAATNLPAPVPGTALGGDDLGSPAVPGSGGGDSTAPPGSAQTATESADAQGVNSGSRLVGSAYGAALGVAALVAVMA